MMRVRRLWLVLVVGAFLLISWAHPASASNSGSFTDDDNSRFEPFIETAKKHGLISGCNPPDNDRFCIGQSMTRGVMAILLARAVGASSADGDHFKDDDGHVAEGAIEALIAQGVPMGCELDRFCPNRPITRGEMAALITRALGWEHTADPSRYRDIAESQFASPLAELAERGGLEPCDPPVNRALCPRKTVKRDEAVFSLVSALGLPPTAITAHGSELPEIGFGDSFDDLSLWDGRSPSHRNRVEITEDGFRASGLQVTIPEGSHFGADFELDLGNEVGEEPEQLFFRYFLRLDSDWATTSSGKLPGFSGIYGSTGKGGYQSKPWEPGWSARLMFSPARGDDPRVPLGYYVYHLGQERRYGDSLRWNEAGKLLPGEWYCLEGEVELNTPGAADGALRAWIDETPAFDETGLQFRRPDEPEIRIESFWFNVYYGGKAVANKDLGMTIDEVVVDTQRIGCETGVEVSARSTGDFDANGYEDRIWWSSCPAGRCFWVETTTTSGAKQKRQVGDGAWFSLETHRFGLETGDVDGSGRSDIVYRGRCDGSVRCWRVHRLSGSRLGTGENWGDGARISPSAAALVFGDWNGDGLDDLAYQGLCGDDAHDCWRVHLSTGSRFETPLDWGGTPGTPTMPRAADITGDSFEDLIYQAPCIHSTCWFVQESTGETFLAPRPLGRAAVAESEHLEVIDFDADGDEDLVSWEMRGETSRISVRFAEPNGLGNPVLLTKLDRQVSDVQLRRIDSGYPVQALVEVDCPDLPCVEYLVAPSATRLADPARFRDRARMRFAIPQIV